MVSTCGYWVRVEHNVRVTYTTNNLQYVHELISGVHSNFLCVTLVRVHIEGTGTCINDNTGQKLVVLIFKGVVRGVVLGTHGWSVLDSLIIGYLGHLVKRKCASPSTVMRSLPRTPRS